VQCDASDFGLGAVLTQTIDGEERVVSFLNRSLNKAERRYSTTEKECLAVLFAIEKLRPYLERTHFTVVTDHYSLNWLNSYRIQLDGLRDGPYASNSTTLPSFIGREGITLYWTLYHGLFLR